MVNLNPSRAAGGGVKPWLLLILVVVLVAFVGACLLWFAVPPRVPEAPVHLVRPGGSSALVASDGETSADAAVTELHAGLLEARNDSQSRATTKSADSARLAGRSIAVFNRSDHLLLERVGAELLERLRSFPGVDRIDYYPAGHGAEPGSLAPDLLITLDLASVEASGLPTSRRLEASIVVHAGSGLVPSPSDHGRLSPPIVEFELSLRVDHVSTMRGVTSSAAKYKLQSESIAEHLAEKLTEHIGDLREQKGVLPELPDAFYPPYREPPDLGLADAYELERVVSFHGLMSRSDTLWRLRSDRDQAEVLADVDQRMQAVGWTGGSARGRDGVREDLLLTKGSALVMAFLPESELGPALPAPQGADGSTVLFVRCIDRMSRDELAEAIEGTLDEPNLDTALLFRRQWTAPQRARVLALLQSSPPRTPRAWMTLAELLHADEDRDGAHDALLRARVLSQALGNRDHLKQRIEHLADALGEVDAPEPTLDRALLAGLGFTELTADAVVPARVVEVGEPVGFFCADDIAEFKTIALRVEAGTRAADDSPYQLVRVESFSGVVMTSTGGMSSWADVDGVGTFLFEATPRDDDRTFRLSTTITKVRD